jgi:hypothetical protein
MFNNRYKNIFFLLFCFPILAFSQEEKEKGEYALVAFAGGGISFFQGHAGTPGSLNAVVNRKAPIGTFRLMWYPDQLLRVGVETGWVKFYSYEIDDNGVKSSTEITGTPILVVFSMAFREHLNVYGGTGTYLVQSKLNYNGIVKATAPSLGWMLAAAYDIPLSQNLGITSEAKWLWASGPKNGSISLQLHMRWKFLRW